MTFIKTRQQRPLRPLLTPKALAVCAALALCVLQLAACGNSDSPWTRSAADPAPLLASPTTQKALSDKVPAEAVAMALVTGSSFPSLLDFWLGGRCGPQPATQLTSRSIATGSFPAFRVQGSIHCPTQDYTWDLVITSQMRIASARMDSLAVEPAPAALTQDSSAAVPVAVSP